MPRNGGNTRHPNSATPSEQQAHQGLLLHSFIRIYRFLLFIWVWISFIPLVFLVRLAGVNFDRTMIFHAYPVLSRYIARLAFSLGQRGYVLSLKKSYQLIPPPIPSFFLHRRLSYSWTPVLHFCSCTITPWMAMKPNIAMSLGITTKYQHKSNKSRYRPFNFQSYCLKSFGHCNFIVIQTPFVVHFQPSSIAVHLSRRN